MIIRIDHASAFAYAEPQRNGVVVLMATPWDFEGQHALSWRIETDPPAKLRGWDDHFGNRCHAFDLPGPFDAVTVSVQGEVDVVDAAGVVRGAPETFPPMFFLRETAATRLDGALETFARSLATGGETLDWLHRTMEKLGEALGCRPSKGIAAEEPASEVFAAGEASSRGFAHVFIALARSRRLPARFVSGYFASPPGVSNVRSGHAWAEVFVDDLGWVGFDASKGQSPTDAYVRVATALDGLGAAPVRIARQGGGDERCEERLRVAAAPLQSQN